MLAKVAALEAAKLKAAQVPDADAVEPTEEQTESSEPPLLALAEEEPRR